MVTDVLGAIAFGTSKADRPLSMEGFLKLDARGD
jgi:hypothetical protein